MVRTIQNIDHACESGCKIEIEMSRLVAYGSSYSSASAWLWPVEGLPFHQLVASVSARLPSTSRLRAFPRSGIFRRWARLLARFRSLPVSGSAEFSSGGGFWQKARKKTKVAADAQAPVFPGIIWVFCFTVVARFQKQIGARHSIGMGSGRVSIGVIPRIR